MVQLMSYATTLLLAAAASVHANGCYTGGLGFSALGENPNSFDHAYNACHGYSDGNGNHVRGAFEGVHFVANSVSNLPATVTVNSSGNCLVLQITNLQGDRVINADQCYSGFEHEMINCGEGGEGPADGWYFRADPNSGPC